MKGVLSHWTVKLQTQPADARGRSQNELLQGMDVKFPLLIGDQYHSISYYMCCRLGNIELVRLLTLIEENFQKIFSNLENITKDFAANLAVIYEHFFNYLPQFMANSLKGVGIIFELSDAQLAALYDLGIELGYFYQFGIFAYIMAAIRR